MLKMTDHEKANITNIINNVAVDCNPITEHIIRSLDEMAVVERNAFSLMFPDHVESFQAYIDGDLPQE